MEKFIEFANKLSYGFISKPLDELMDELDEEQKELAIEILNSVGQELLNIIQTEVDEYVEGVMEDI